MAMWMYCENCGWQTEHPGWACGNQCPWCTAKLWYVSVSDEEIAEMEEKKLTVREYAKNKRETEHGR
jgi:hypothetical protein